MRVKLKIGAQMMCLRNMNALTLCNGTKQVVQQLYDFVIDVTPITGLAAWKNVLIP
jgi:hypothetical protein